MTLTYDYQVVDLTQEQLSDGEELERILNSFGEKGWDLTGNPMQIVEAPDDAGVISALKGQIQPKFIFRFIFKRAIESA